jgi:hypothetical protein
MCYWAEGEALESVLMKSIQLPILASLLSENYAEKKNLNEFVLQQENSKQKGKHEAKGTRFSKNSREGLNNDIIKYDLLRLF